MLFPKRPRSRHLAFTKRDRHSRRWSRRNPAFIPDRICCGPTAEKLEERTMLSAVASTALGTAVPFGSINSNVKSMASPGSQGYTPQQIQSAYEINQIEFNGVVGNGAGQTIAVIDAYNDPNIVNDAATFSSYFGLPQFNTTGGPTFQVLNQGGGTGLPTTNGGGWDTQESLDVEWVHAVAPQANVILFEANSSQPADLYSAVTTAAGYPGVSVVSMDWGSPEFTNELQDDSIFLTPAGHQGVTFLAGAFVVNTQHVNAYYPAYSPNVVGVGGTSLVIDSSGQDVEENGWSNSGGGISQDEWLPSYQDGIAFSNGASDTRRNAPDVSADADPDTGVWIYDSYSAGGWVTFGAAACDLWAGIIGVANQGRALAGEGTLNGATQTLPMLYSMPESYFRDITSGNNGTYFAGRGYDLVTGLGTPIANDVAWYLGGYYNSPEINVPTSQSLAEDSPLVFSTSNNNAITVTDGWSAGQDVDAYLSTSSVSGPNGQEWGALGLTNTTGLTFVNGQNDTYQFEVVGTVANLNADLDGLTFQPPAGYVGSDQISLSVVNPLPPVESSTASINLNIHVYYPPTFSVPLAASVDENGTLAFTAADGNAINLFDNQFTNEDMTLSANNGTLALGTTAGLTVTGNGTSSVTATGDLSDIDSALATLTYTPTSGYSGSDSLVLHDEDVTDGLSGNAIVPITVLQMSISAPVDVGVIENESFDFDNSNLIAVNDPSGTSGTNEEMTLQVSQGTLTLTTTGLAASGVGTSSVTLTGPLSDLNSDLSSLVYTPTTGYTGSDMLNISNEDTVDNVSATAAVGITVAAGLPVFGGPTNGTTTVNIPLSFSSASGNEITVTDPGAGSYLFDSLSLSVLNGTLTLGSTTGLSVTGGAYGSNSFTVSGPIGDLNAALNGFTYQPDSNYIGTDTLSMLLANPTDSLSTTGSVAITVVPISPPTITAPAAASVSETGSLVFSSANGNPISFTDNGSGYSSDTMTLSVSNGTLTLGTTAGLVFAGGSDDAASMTIKGTVANLNAGLAGLTYTPTAAGSDTLSIQVYDPNDNQSGSASVAITVSALAPSITAPASASVTQNGSLTFSSGNGNAISVTDINPSNDALTLSVSHGTLTLSTTSGLSFTSGSNDSASFTVVGAASSLNAALSGLVYQPALAYYGSDTLAISLLDQEDNLSASKNVALSINELPPPSITAPSTGLAASNVSLVFSSANGNAIYVVDNGIGSGSDSLTLSVTHGTLTLATTTGLTFTAGTNGSSSFTVSGNLTNLDAALNGLTYTPTSGYLGTDTLQISVSDPGDGESASTSVALTIDLYLPPTISGTGNEIVAENNELVFSTTTQNPITLADTGPGSGSDSLSLSVSHGNFWLATMSGLTVTSGTNGSSSITVTGSVANLNAALNGLDYQPVANYIGSDSLGISIKDASDNLSASASININVSAIDWPAIKAPASVAIKGKFTFAGVDAISITDPNAGSNVEQLVIRATGGTLSLGTTTGLTFTQGANNSGYMVVEGTLANFNAAVATLSYTLSGTSQTIVMAYTNLQNNESGTAAIAVTAQGGTKTSGGGGSEAIIGNSPTTGIPAGPAVSTTTSTSNSTDNPASTASSPPTVAATDASSNAPAVSTTDDDSTSSGTPLYEGLLSAVEVLMG